MLLGVVEGKVYCRDEREHSPKQRPLGEPRANRNLNQDLWGEKGGEAGNPGDQETKRPGG